MQSFLGIYGRTLYRDEKTGYTSFSVTTKADVPKNEFGAVLCTGIIPIYPAHMPLELTGTFEEKNGYTYFIIKKCKNKSDSENVTISFLAGDNFDGIGEKIADGIVKYAGSNIFEFVKKENADKLLSKNVKGLSEETARKIVTKIKNLSALEDLITYIVSVGGCYEDAIHIYDKYGAMAQNTMQKNPYMLRYAGARYETCEAIAKKRGWESCDSRRVKAIVEHCMEQNENNGNTIISYKELYQNIKKLENFSNMGYNTAQIFVIKELLSSNYVIENINDELYISRKDTYEAESVIAKEILRLKHSAINLSTENYSIAEIEKICGIHYEESQRNSFSALSTTGVKIITGGPGSGKTTTLNGILKKYELENPDKKIELCAPTGRAAKKIEESTGRKAQTIHRLLQIRPFGEDIKSKDAYDQLDADCIVVDESSMLDTKLFAMLLKSIKNGALLILVGDKDQLQSVGAGNILRDLLKSQAIETYYLKESFRQAETNELHKNALRIKNGDTNLKEDESFIIKRFKSDEDLTKAAVDLMKANFDKSNPAKTRLFTPVRKKTYVASSTTLNKELKEYINPSAGETLTYGGYTFAVNDLVIMTANNYNKGYFNGDEGIIIDIQIHTYHKYITVLLDNDLKITVTGKELADIELAYSLTAHKCQGGECENAIILIPKKPKSLLIRSLVYVEATRATKLNILLVEEDALEEAIRNCYMKERITALVYRIKEEMIC